MCPRAPAVMESCMRQEGIAGGRRLHRIECKSERGTLKQWSRWHAKSRERAGRHGDASGCIRPGRASQQWAKQPTNYSPRHAITARPPTNVLFGDTVHNFSRSNLHLESACKKKRRSSHSRPSTSFRRLASSNAFVPLSLHILRSCVDDDRVPIYFLNSQEATPSIAPSQKPNGLAWRQPPQINNSARIPRRGSHL